MCLEPLPFKPPPVESRGVPLWLVEAWPHEISKPTSLVHHSVCRANDTEFNLEDYCTMLAVIVIVYEVIYEARMHDIGTWEATSADIGPRLRRCEWT